LLPEAYYARVMGMTLTSAAVLLLLVMDPFGSIPMFIAALGQVPEGRRNRVIKRESAVALLVLLFFMVAGNEVLHVLHLSGASLGIAGGIILFLIALRMIFPSRHSMFGDLPDGEPFIVPLAVPLIAGPSAVATVMLLVSRWPAQIGQWIIALLIAQALTTLVLCAGNRVAQRMGRRGMIAAERLMGLLLTTLSVEMFLQGVREFMQQLQP